MNFTVGKSLQFSPIPITTVSGIVLWDRTFTGVEAQKGIDKINDILSTEGLYDPVTKQRIAIPAERRITKRPKIRIEDFFTKEGSAFPVFPGNDVQKMLARFDHPELLAVEVTPWGETVIFHGRDKEIMKKRREIANAVLREKGLTLEDAADLDSEKRLELMHEVQRRFQSPDEAPRSEFTLLFRVDEYFKRKERVFVVPTGEDPEKILQSFDHPELLEIESNAAGLAIIYPKANKEDVLARRVEVGTFLEEQGITNHEQLANLTPQDKIRLREEFQKRKKIE